MRLMVRCRLDRETACPVNHQDLLTGVVYRLLESSDADYARFLHEQGYRLDGGPKRFKLFVFSGLRSQRRRIVGETLWLAPGPVDWYLSSPVEPFLVNAATGLLSAGELRVGPARLEITEVQTLPEPDFSSGTARFTCLTPIVAGVPIPGADGGVRYLRPTEGDAFSEAVRCNLLRKYHTIHGRPPEEDRFALTFDPSYLEKSGGGTKKITYKQIDVIGALCPFAVSGSAELLTVGYGCGFGEKNAGGFGMVEVK